jgi:acyl carrier protein
MIFTTLKEILIDLGIDENALQEHAHLRKDLELDSTETVEIALALKRRLGVDIKLEARQDPTLAEVCAQVEQAKATIIT